MKLFGFILVAISATKPFLIEKPDNVIVNIGATVELRCVIGGQRVPEHVSHAIQWIDQSRGHSINTFQSGRRVNKKYNERFSIVGEESRGEWHLRIQNITSADSGRFQCQLHSGNGDGAAKVLVRVPPKSIEIDELDKNGYLAHNQGRTTVKCFAFDSRPAAQIKFYFRGEEIDSSEEEEQIDDCQSTTGFCNSTATFDFIPTDLRNFEPIECRVFHDAMSNYSVVKTKSYPFQKPTAELIGPENGQVLENSEQNFECYAVGHPQPSVFYWTVNNGIEEKSLSPIKSITIVRRSNNAPFEISCRSESTFKRRKIMSIESAQVLQIIWGPEMKFGYDDRETISINEGTTSTLSCPFQSYPPPIVTWVLHQSDHAVEKSTDRSKYTIENASPRDTGKWTCTAKNPITGAEAARSTFVNVQLLPQFSSADVQEIGKNRTRPIVQCTFQYKYTTESFGRISWSMKNTTHQIPLDTLNMKIPNEIGTAMPVTIGRFQAKWTDVTGDSATALLTISDATDKELEMDFLCEVENSVGISSQAIRLTSSMSPLMADVLVISGSVLGVLVVILLLTALILIQCRRRRSTKSPQRKLTPDLIQHNVNLPPPLEHQLDHRQDAEINISDAVLNRSGRTWGSQKPPSTCSGPDDGYSTERGAGDCSSSKTESGSRLPNVVVEANHEVDSFDGETYSCHNYVSENRVQTERMYSTLQGGAQRSFGRFSTLQTRTPQVQVQCSIRPSSAQPHFIAPLSESLDDLDHAEQKQTSSESSSDTYNSSNQPLLRKSDFSANVFLQNRPYTARSVSHV